ncbi:UvrD-helicase domain-containing protein [Arthrobacter sp. H14]|uniref:UvrD-helicase domain-containing protein n=1 Tax=Arthrobacter sp. H14 TaxID=1312959 RepID=UPI0004AD34AB|nr:UvrD-helicase domain-containing protein [Arthrobacter sp. H14]
MAEQDTLEAIKECIDARESFVVEAGAGSGKTRSLIETIQSILAAERADLERTDHRVVCITYTNVAKDEIITRLNGDPLVLVDTIHEFLWSVCSGFQRELKIEVLAINEAAKTPVDGLAEILESVPITYGQFGRHFDRGELFHDDVISAAAALFEKYPKITRIVADRFPYIFVDEYQDTAAAVIDLLLKYFVKNPRKPVVGFFGDSMQQIYDSNISDVATNHGLRSITKVENYRCSVKVIGVLNRLRSDLAQQPTGDNLPGDVHLLVADGVADGVYEKALAELANDGWTKANTKILMLTHRGIAREIGYTDLLAAYSKRSFGNGLLMERSDEFGELFTFVEGLVASHDAHKYGRFLTLLGQSGYTIRAAGDKAKILAEMERLTEARASGSVGDVVEFIAKSPLIPLSRKLVRLRQRLATDPTDDDESLAARRVFYDAVLAVPWSQASIFVDYADQHTPFSTKHGVKGAEFENVLVLIDDKLWNRYKFYGVLTGTDTSSDRLERSRKLLYVCFSRAMKGLAVVCLNPLSAEELGGAKALLGVDDVLRLT